MKMSCICCLPGILPGKKDEFRGYGHGEVSKSQWNGMRAVSPKPLSNPSEEILAGSGPVKKSRLFSNVAFDFAIAFKPNRHGQSFSSN